MSEIAVKGCIFQASLDPGVGTITAGLSTTTKESDKVAVDSKGVYFEKITVTVASGSSVVLNSPPSGAGSNTGTLAQADTIDIMGTANNILDSKSSKAVQKDDSGSKVLTFTFPTSTTPPSTMTYPVNVTVKVLDAGQLYVVAS